MAFQNLSKEKLFEVMKTLAYAFNKAWLKSERLAIQKCGLDAFLGEEFNEVFQEFGSIQSKKLKELSIVSGTDVDSIIKALRLSQWALFEDIDLTKLSGSVIRMRTIGCSLQRYARKKWGTDYPCKNLDFSLEGRRGFVKAINPRAEVECNFCPPDPRPENISMNVSCEWFISIPKE